MFRKANLAILAAIGFGMVLGYVAASSNLDLPKCAGGEPTTCCREHNRIELGSPAKRQSDAAISSNAAQPNCRFFIELSRQEAEHPGDFRRRHWRYRRVMSVVNSANMFCRSTRHCRRV